MLAGILGWLATSALGTFLKSLAATVLQAIEQQQARADQIALGQQRQVTADAVATLQIQNRMAQAAVQPHDVGTAIARLDAGTL